MLPASESISQELAVNFFRRETWVQERINVWKVQGTPPASVQVGQTIWFHFNIFVMGGGGFWEVCGGCEGGTVDWQVQV